MEKIAILGGTPIRVEPLSYGKQYIDEADIEAVTKVLKSPFLTCGPKVPELEKKLCEVTGAKFAVAVSNGTAALHIACLAAGIGPGDEVITTSLTFAASANCVRYCGANVVFADINPETYCIDPDEIEKKISTATKAVLAVDFTGQAVEHKRIREICERHNIMFIEDAAHSIGTKYNEEPIGSLADMTCFSFHPVKTVTSGEGGAITTNDEKLYKRLMLFRTHGITHDSAEMSEQSEERWYYEMIELGYNYRLTDIQCALLISQLNKLEMFSLRRKNLVEFYNRAFTDIDGIIVQKEIPESDTTRHLYIIRIDPEKLTCTRREFFDAMTAEGINCQVHYIPVYWFPYYKRLGYDKGLCPNAERIYETEMSIPLYYSLTDKDASDVVAAVKKIVEWYHR